jgi:hypothetical protein
MFCMKSRGRKSFTSQAAAPDPDVFPAVQVFPDVPTTHELGLQDRLPNWRALSSKAVPA